MKTLLFAFALVAASTGTMAFASPASVWEHHIAAWEARDLDALMADYDHDSLMIVNNRQYQGVVPIRGVFARLFEIFDAGSNQIDPPTLAGRVVYITWRFTPTLDSQPRVGTDTFIIESDKIRVQTIASPLYDDFPIDVTGTPVP